MVSNAIKTKAYSYGAQDIVNSWQLNKNMRFTILAPQSGTTMIDGFTLATFAMTILRRTRTRRGGQITE